MVAARPWARAAVTARPGTAARGAGGARRRAPGGGTRARVAARHERDHAVVVADLPDLSSRTRPGPTGMVVCAIAGGGAARAPGPPRCSRRISSSCGSVLGSWVGRQNGGSAGRYHLGHGRLQRGSSVEWVALWRSPNRLRKSRPRPRVPRRGGSSHAGDGGHLAVALLPRRQQRQEDVVAVARHVAPPGRPLLVHRHRVAVAPHEVHREVPQQRGARLVVARADALEDLGAGRRLGLEVALTRLPALQRLGPRSPVALKLREDNRRVR